MEVIDTGRTFADTWADADGDVARQRALLANGVETVLVAPGRAGRRPFAVERVTIVPAEGHNIDAEDGESTGPADPAMRSRLGLKDVA